MVDEHAKQSRCYKLGSIARRLTGQVDFMMARGLHSCGNNVHELTKRALDVPRSHEDDSES